MNEHERGNLLFDYMTKEPKIRHNCEDWLIAARREQDGSVTFFATHFDEIGAVVRVKGESWVQINDSLSMAYTYALVLDELERMLDG